MEFSKDQTVYDPWRTMTESSAMWPYDSDLKINTMC